MAQRSSEAEGAFGDIKKKKNFGYSLLRRRGESEVRVELGLVILGVQFEALSSTKNKVDEVRTSYPQRQERKEKSRLRNSLERVKVFSECFLFRSFYLKLWKT